MSHEKKHEPSEGNPSEKLQKEIEDAMAVYGDTDMDPNRDDQKDLHHGAEDEEEREER